MAATIQLVPGSLDAAAKSEADGPLTLKVADFSKAANGKWMCTVTDGSQKLKGVLASQIVKKLEAGTLLLNEGAVIKTERYNLNQVNDALVCIMTDVEVLQQGDGSSAADAAIAGSDANGSKADQQATPQGAPKQQPRTPASTPVVATAGAGSGAGGVGAAAAGRALQTPGPAPSPSEEIKGTPGMTPAASHSMHQPSFTPMATAATGGKTAAGGVGGAARTSAAPTPSPRAVAVAERAGAQPIAALNPYQKNWVIKAMVTRKSLLRTFNKGSVENKVFDVELADAMGTQIQGSFWRESADRFYDSLQEGKVYYFSNFVVKPANKQFATVRNDYQITFDARTEVEEARDQGGISTDVQVDIVPLDKLSKHIGRKAPIDVLGVVTAVGPIGTVKRKADNSELMKRELTLADSSKYTVSLTLWGDNATRADLDNVEGRTLQVTSVKANEFNGCSLSGLTRSKVTIDPDTQEAAELRTWWEAEGSTATLTPLGQTLQGGAGGGVSGGPRRNKLELLSAVTPDGPLPAPDAKPTYHDVVATFVQVLEERPIMYLANPANGKKVVPQDGRYWCEGDGCFIDVPEQRYMMTAKVADASGEVYVTVFNEQGAQLMGCSADEAAAKQENDPQALKSLLQQTQWSEWKMTLAARTREYNGERRMRCSVQRMAPMDYAAEGHRLLQLITQPQQ